MSELCRPNLTWSAPPSGWVTFGTHAGLAEVPALRWSLELGDDGLPLFERHDGCTCDLGGSAR